MYKKVISCLSIICLVVLFTMSTSNAGMKKTVSSTKAPTKQKKHLNISWKIRNNQILHDTVCFDYEEGSIDYRNCRSDARELFRDRCDEWTDKFRSSKQYNQKYRDKQDMYCDAGVRFRP